MRVKTTRKTMRSMTTRKVVMMMMRTTTTMMMTMMLRMARAKNLLPS